MDAIDHLKLNALLYLMLLSLIWMRRHAHLYWMLRTSVCYVNYRPDGQHIPAPLCHDSALACQNFPTQADDPEMDNVKITLFML